MAKQRKQRALYDARGWHTKLGHRVWSDTEEMLRAYLLKRHREGISVRDTLLIIHETAGAAAQHVGNIFSSKLKVVKVRRD